MTADARPDTKSIFGLALELSDADRRAAYLDEACAGRPGVRSEVEELLAVHEKAGGFLRKSPALAIDLTGAYEPIAEGPGTRVGPYKLLQEIGEGGMGTVYMAEQEEPVRRKVALKIIKPGMDSKQVVARFEVERQALSMMDHPNIAKVLDAGTTEAGRPYFVMELVHGTPITEFCDANQFSPRQRLELFIPVCQAIQHAHMKGVIHRDIKPSNVLVTMYDDKPVPKVIDFGVAKAVEQRLTEKTLFTQYGALVGTFEYMSPEQAEMNAFGVDTRSDVYSLGVLLYELLTGSTPLERQRLRTAALGEVVRLIREEEPPRPSIRLSSSGTLAKLAAARKTEPAKLSALVRGELDWIVMRCLEKDRTRRYESASSLAKDVQRHLGGDAVDACPPTLGYRFRKAYRKNRLAVLIGSAFAAVFLIAAGVSIIFGFAAKRAEGDAERRRTEADDNAAQARENEQIAQSRTHEANAARDDLRRVLYASNLNLIQAAWERNDVARVLQLLEATRPKPGEEDFRGIEWHYWDRMCHAELRTFQVDGPFTQVGSLLRETTPRETTAFSPEARYLAFVSTERNLTIVGNRPEPMDFVAICDVAAERIIARYPLRRNEHIFALSLGQEGKRLAILTCKNGLPDDQLGKYELRGIADYRLVVWDVKKQGILMEKEFSHEWESILIFLGLHPHQGVALSPDGELVACTVCQNGGMEKSKSVTRIWESATGKEKTVIPSGARCLTFIEGGRTLATAESTGGVRESIPSCEVRLFDTSTGELKKTVRVQDESPQYVTESMVVPAIAFSPDGTRFAAFFSEHLRPGQQARGSVWDFSGKQLATFDVPFSQHNSLQFTPDGERLAVTSQLAKMVQIVDARTGVVGLTIKVEKNLVALRFNASARELVTIDMIGFVKKWNVAPTNERSIPNYTMDSADRSRRIEFDPKLFDEKDKRQLIRVRDTAGKELQTFREHKSLIRSVAVSADGRYAFTSDAEGLALVWETSTGAVRLTLQLPMKLEESKLEECLIRTLAVNCFRADGRQVLLPVPGGGVKLWDLESMRELLSDPLALKGEYCPNENQLITIEYSEDKKSSTAKVWDVPSRQVLWTFPVPSGDDHHPSRWWSPDGSRLLVIPSRPSLLDRDPKHKILALDGTTGRELYRLNLNVYHLSFRADGKQFVTSYRSDVRTWDATTGQELRRFNVPSNHLVYVALSPDGKRLASRTGFLGANETKIWDTSTGLELLSIRDGDRLNSGGGPGYGPGPVNFVYFSPDGCRVLSDNAEVWLGWVGGIPVGKGHVIADGTPRRNEKQP